MLLLQNIPLNDEDTWNILRSGKTVGIFQMESRLMQDWLSKIKPKNLWELAIVIAIVRPQCLDSGSAGLFLEKRNNPNKVALFNNDIVDSILGNTNGEIIFQEQCMNLGYHLAWKHLDETQRLVNVDLLRSAIGKKKADKILEMGKKFVEGCDHNNISKEISIKLYDVIRAAGRYGFNASHAFSYAYVAYYTAYLKTHYPLLFYTVYLNFSTEKMHSDEEITNLIQDARANNFTILPPNINKKNLDFVPEGTDKIRFGLSYIKAVANSLNSTIENLPEIKTWKQVLQLANPETKNKPRSTAMEALILSGAFSDTGVCRNKLFHAYEFIGCLTPKEAKYFFEHLFQFDNIEDIHKLVDLVASNASAKKRQQIMLSEAKILEVNLQKEDHPLWIESVEQKYLNSILSGSVTMPFEHMSDYNCYEASLIQRMAEIKPFSIIGVIDTIQEFKIKSGKNIGKTMCKIKIHDSTASLDNVLIFAKGYEALQGKIMKEKVLHFKVRHSPNTGIVVDDILEID